MTIKTMKNMFLTACVLTLLCFEKCQSQLSYSYRTGRNQILDPTETLSSPYKVILHNKRFMKVPRSKLQPADDNADFKDSRKDVPDRDVNYSETKSKGLDIGARRIMKSDRTRNTLTRTKHFCS